LSSSWAVILPIKLRLVPSGFIIANVLFIPKVLVIK
jgi:hypothetical protein